MTETAMNVDTLRGDGPQDELFDVAIVGYGPVGQALALALAQQGHRIAVIERWPAPFGLPRAVGLDHEVMRILQSLGVTQEFEPHTTRSQVYEWRNGAGELLVAFPGLDETGPSGWPAGPSFSQPTLERILSERVRNDHGGQVEVLLGMAVSGISESENRVLLEAWPNSPDTASGAAGPRRIAARWVVGCDGAGSIVRQQMCATYEDIAFAADWLVVDLQPKDPARWSSELIQVCDPKRPTTMVSGGPGRRRFEFMMLEGERKEDFNNAQAAWALLERWGWTPANAVLERHAVYTFRACVADVWRRGRVMIAGDAAHLTPPFAGQGLCAGLRDAMALAWRLDLVLRGGAADGLLDSYGDERRPHARALIEFAVELGRIICVLDPDAARQRDARLRADAAELSRRKFPAPPLGASPLVRGADPQAGCLGRQGRVYQRGRVGRFDDLVGTGFVLIGDGHDPANRLGSEQLAFLQRIGVTSVGIGQGCALRDIDGTYRRWFDELGCSAVLLRPDFYVYGAGEAAELVDDLMAAWAA
ncbi:bifunctional 3-(3-hydroxy-phenyl)propionate/3-hydroxycinnamic acid hydroxylase [Ottowia pentelensis]|uniref:Bifunctional 3-(3-hydroxy-phenyl)propionate/3-hydroxycinnamic acid hydroxylase n=2 Tax=Ottowia pentelensis TaxID=511108 RepID=A0ABV6PQQ6_9BURK